MRTINAMTIDVEDYFQVSAFADRISPRDWPQYPSRVEQNTHRLLRLLDRTGLRATFFVLGWVAERFPQLVRAIARDGHEIGCHSHWHRLVYDLTPEEFREDTLRAKNVLEDIVGERVTLYRAPSFSITPRSLWALDILAELGFDCDSSIYPIRHDRYGIPGADPFPHILRTSAGDLCEFPGSVYRLSGLSVPISGGGYFRLYPAQLTASLLERVNVRSGRPFMFYIHPWEVDPEQPRLPGSLRSRFRHYQNLASTERKLEWLLPRFRFGAMGDVLAAEHELGYATRYAVNAGNGDMYATSERVATPISAERFNGSLPKQRLILSQESSGVGLSPNLPDTPRPVARKEPRSSRPQLLYVTHRVPHPPNRGDRIRTYHFLRHLSQHSDIWLACLADEPVSEESRRELNRLCREVAIVPVEPRRRWLRGGVSLLSGRTISEGMFQSPRLTQQLTEWGGEVSFNATLASSSALASYLRLPALKSAAAFVDLIDVDSQKWLDYAAASHGPKAWLYQHEGRRLRAVETELATWTQGLTVVSQAEADIYRGFCPNGPIQAIANGVDVDYFQPQPMSSERGCVFVGALDYKPNIDGAVWFCRNVWPRLREQRPNEILRLVGREPSREVRELGQIPGVEVIGSVPDVRPYLAEAAVVVVPLQIARGVQNKVLEALAMGKAVVSSPAPIVGLQVEAGIHLVSATTPNEWVSRLVELLEDRSLRNDIGMAGQAYVTAYHRWAQCLESLPRFLGIAAVSEGAIPLAVEEGSLNGTLEARMSNGGEKP